MTTLISNDPPSSAVTSGLSIRIVQPETDERIVPLPSGKCTVGSSERCQIHLACGDARPLHCLIVHEGSATTITRWAPGALLNGQDFATAPFQPGDCLQIGEVQLLLVAEVNDSQEPQDPPEHPATAAASNALVSPVPMEANSAFAPPTTPVEQPAAVADLPEPAVEVTQPAFPSMATPDTNVASALEVDRLADRLKTANNSARKRCRKLVGALRTMRTEASSFDQKVDDLQRELAVALEEREQIFTQLSHLQEEAGERESQSSEEIDRLISELTTAYEKASTAESSLAEHVTQAEQLQSELASLHGQREQWEQIRSAGELQRAKLAEALADRERSIDTLQAEIDQSREAASHAEASREEQTSALKALQNELEQVVAEREQLAAAQTQSQQYQQEIEQALTDSEQNLSVFQLELEKFQLTSRKTDQELFESNAALENLQAEFAQFSEERDQLVTKRTEYQLREQGWEHELSIRDTQIEKLSGEIEQFRSTLAAATQGAAEQVSQLESVQQQLDTLTIERDQLLAAHAEQLQKIQESEETVAARDHRIKELEEEHEGICQMLQSVEEGAFEQVDSCNKLEKQLASVRAERDQLATAFPEQKEYTKQLEQALAERDGQITLLSDELTKTSQRQTELESLLAERTSASRALEAELAELSTRCEKLVAEQNTNQQNQAEVEQTLSQYQGLIEELQGQIDAAQQQRQELEQAVAQGTQTNDASQAKFDELQARYEKLNTEHQAETERRHDLDHQLAEQQQNVELFQVDLKSVNAELDRSVEQVSSLQTERETLNQQLTGLREELATQELESHNRGDEAANTELQQQRDELSSELAATRQQLEEIRQQAAITGGGASATQELCKQLEEEKAVLQQRVEQQELQAQQLDAELQEVRGQWTAGQSEFEQLGQLYQQSQSDLEQARQCLQIAEQALQDRGDAPIAAPAETLEQGSEEAPEVLAESGVESYEAVTDDLVYDETPQETADFHDAYAPETTYSAEEAYRAEAENFAASESAEIDQDVEEAAPTDEATGGSEDVSDVLDDLESTSIAEPIESTSTAFDKPEPELPAEETTQDFQPTSFIDQYQHMLDDGEEASMESIQSEPEPAPVENKLGAELDASQSDSDEDEAALEAYMSNMLRRMRGDDNDEEAQPQQASSGTRLNQNPNPVAAVDNVLDRVAPEREVAADPQDDEPFDLEKLKHSSQKPALPTDLSAMRELANSSARRAIAKHHKRLHREKAFGLFLACLIIIGVGGYMLLTAVAAQEFLGRNFLGGAVAVVAGVFGVFKMLGQLLLAIREGAWEKKKPAKQASEQTPQD